MAILSQAQIEAIGFGSVGHNVLISDKASFYGANRIRIGDNVRIDDYCVLSAGEGGILIGNYVHIAVFSSLIGAGRIIICDFCNISSRVSIYSSNDDYSGKALTNPTVPKEFTNVRHSDVILNKHVIIGSGSVVLPGLILEEGVAIGALSLVTNDCKPFGVYAGTPAKFLKMRKSDLLEIEKQFLNSKQGTQ